MFHSRIGSMKESVGPRLAGGCRERGQWLTEAACRLRNCVPVEEAGTKDYSNTSASRLQLFLAGIAVAAFGEG